MSYEKAIRVVDVIAARNDATVARVALAEVKSILRSLIQIRDCVGAPVRPIDQLLAEADPDDLPAHEPQDHGPKSKSAQTRKERGWVHQNAWSPERQEALFAYLASGKQVTDAVNHFGVTRSSIRHQLDEHTKPGDPRFAHLATRPGRRKAAA